MQRIFIRPMTKSTKWNSMTRKALRNLLSIWRQRRNNSQFKLIANQNKAQNNSVLSFIYYIREP